MKLSYAFPEPLPISRARGIQCAHTAVELARLGLEVSLYHVAGPGHATRAYGLEPPQTLRLVPVSRSLPWPLRRVHSNRLFLARLMREAGGELGGSIVFVRHLKLAALLLGKAPSAPLVYEAHEVFADTAPPRKADARRAEEAKVMREAAAVVCNSAATAARLAERYGPARRLKVVPNGVDWPHELPPKPWDAPGRRIVYAGSLFPWKGAADLVAAAASLPGCRIELVGGDAETVRGLAEGASRSGAELHFAGQLPHREALARLAGACIAVLPNRADPDSAFTSPIKLFEYMAAGCAIVAADLPSIREILAQDEAQWARPGDPAALAAAIAALAADPERARRLGERVRAKAREFTWAARAARLRALFQAIGAGR